jgi:hypothetical protein
LRRNLSAVVRQIRTNLYEPREYSG